MAEKNITTCPVCGAKNVQIHPRAMKQGMDSRTFRHGTKAKPQTLKETIEHLNFEDRTRLDGTKFEEPRLKIAAKALPGPRDSFPKSKRKKDSRKDSATMKALKENRKNRPKS